jgi:hypothetical protein
MGANAELRLLRYRLVEVLVELAASSEEQIAYFDRTDNTVDEVVNGSTGLASSRRPSEPRVSCPNRRSGRSRGSTACSPQCKLTRMSLCGQTTLLRTSTSGIEYGHSLAQHCEISMTSGCRFRASTTRCSALSMRRPTQRSRPPEDGAGPQTTPCASRRNRADTRAATEPRVGDRPRVLASLVRLRRAACNALVTRALPRAAQPSYR